MKRRNFLQTTASASFAGMSAASAERVLGANRRVRLALVGCGGRGRSVARNMIKVDGAEYVATCDVYDTNAERARNELNTRALSLSFFLKRSSAAIPRASISARAWARVRTRAATTSAAISTRRLKFPDPRSTGSARWPQEH